MGVIQVYNFIRNMFSVQCIFNGLQQVKLWMQLSVTEIKILSTDLCYETAEQREGKKWLFSLIQSKTIVPYKFTYF
jgi:hypothetical protein